MPFLLPSEEDENEVDVLSGELERLRSEEHLVDFSETLETMSSKVGFFFFHNFSMNLSFLFHFSLIISSSLLNQ